MAFQYSPQDRDYLIRTVIGESRGQPFAGQLGVAHTVLNRVRAGGYGQGIQGVLFKKAQFEPWGRRRDELMSYGPQTSGWDDAARATDLALSGQAPDPTNGATHFANKAVVAQRGDPAGRAGGWLSRMGNQTTIGAHTFGNADGRGAGRAQPFVAAQAQGPLMGGAQQGEAGAQQIPLANQPEQPAVQTAQAPTPDRTKMGLIDLAMSPEGITGGDVKNLFSSGKVTNALSGLSQAFGGGQQKQQAPQIQPVQAEVNTPDMSLLEMMRRKQFGRRGMRNGLA